MGRVGRVGQDALKERLDRLYSSFNCVDSATDPIQLVRRFQDPADREVAGFCAAALAFGRVASVLQSIERLFSVMGRSPAEYVRTFDPRRQARDLTPIVHRWTKGDDLAALVIILQRMLQKGSIEAFFLEGYDSQARRFVSRPRVVLDAGAADRPAARIWQSHAATGCCLLLLEAFVRWRLQEAEPVSPVDGPQRRCGFRDLEERARGQACRAPRHARHSCRAVPAPDSLYEPRLEDGGRHHGVASRTGCGRSGEIRFLVVPPRHGGSVRVQPRAGGFDVPAPWLMPSAASWWTPPCLR